MERVEDQVVLVDSRDNVIGTMPKLEAHEKGVLHRAISVFIFNRDGDLLLQRRADSKYHSAGLWSNTCCSHPYPDERPHLAAIRRLREEMGIECGLRFAFAFLYRAELDSGLTEHELDHVYVGEFEGDPQPDPDEVGEWRWISPGELAAELESAPERFSAWFPIALERLLANAEGA